MGKTVTVLVVDDEKNAREGLALALENADYKVLTAAGGEEALAILRGGGVELVLTDLKMPHMDGMALLQAIQDEIGALPVIIVTGFATIDTAVEAMRLGATDYVAKPFSLADVRLKVRLALDRARQTQEMQQLKDQLTQILQPGQIVGESPKMRDILDLIAQIAPAKSNVLICGESGTGKELIARALHFESPRKDRPFVSLNCGALPAELLENELFGHERGAFTGATDKKLGLMEVADDGSLFLDEIAELPLALQVKLLRSIQEREIRRLGGTENIPVTFRLVTATNRDLETLVTQNAFREDLFYRLNVLTITVPPLRERREDIPVLAKHFLKTYANREGKDIEDFTAAAMHLLEGYAWPGNVRELENVVERAVILVRGKKVSPKDLPPNLADAVGQEALGGSLPTLEEAEKEYILKVLDRVGGNRTQAAKVLGMDRSSLWRKLKIYQKDANS